MPSSDNKPNRLRILVPTDFSPASKAGVRFAIRWSHQQDVELLFVHVLNTIVSPSWAEERQTSYANQQRRKYLRMLKQITNHLYQRAGIARKFTSCMLIEATSVDVALLDYCRQDGHVDYICMSTRGAGGIKRVFGTHTGNLITHSKVPVLAIPATYKSQRIDRVLYAGDMTNNQHELPLVVRFASGIGARIDTLQTDHSLSFAKNLEKTIRSSKPSVVVLFTNQDRSVISRIFNPSRAEWLSFDLKTPLLAFAK